MLQEITEDMWEVAGRVKMIPGMYLPCRMTVIRLSDGRLVLHSPVEMDDATVAQIEELGEVAYLVAPNAWHHLFLEEAQARFPNAETWGAPGLPEKRDDLDFDGILGRDELPFGDEIERITIEGAPDISESVFFHRSSKTLICTDLLFNLQTTDGWLTPWMLRMFGTYKTFAHSRLWRTKYADRAAVAASARHMCAWPIERVVMAHGEIVEEGCEQKLEQAFAWLFSKEPEADRQESAA